MSFDCGSCIQQLTARRCQECGQTLPPTYQPPADEDWSTGIFGCAEDAGSCKCFLYLFMFQFFSYCALNACFCQVLKEIKCSTSIRSLPSFEI